MATMVKVMSEQSALAIVLECRAEALSLAQRVGVAAATRELGLYATQIYQWRSKVAHERSVNDRERELREENARLERQLAEKTKEFEILGKTAAYCAKNPV